MERSVAIIRSSRSGLPLGRTPWGSLRGLGMTPAFRPGRTGKHFALRGVAYRNVLAQVLRGSSFCVFHQMKKSVDNF